MGNQTSHFSDGELLLWVDGELRRGRAAQVRIHLTACGDCRSRLAQIEATTHQFMLEHRASIPALPAKASSRAELKARLSKLTMRENAGPQQAGHWALGVWVVAACLLLAMGGIFLSHHAGGLNPERTLYASSLPNPLLTPGAALAADINDLCSRPHDEVIRTVPSSLQETVLREYGLPPARAQSFEIDFLISPGLGGAESLRNLWPEPRYHAVWNSFVKDQLEDYLHQAVCDGRISLKGAQQDIASDWISAYQKYFHTTKPLTAVSDLAGVHARTISPVSTFGLSARLDVAQ